MYFSKESRLAFPFRRSVTLAWLGAFVFSLCLAGCAPRPPQTYPVAIKLTYSNQKPVAGAQVALISAEHKTTARGVTGSDGASNLTTFKVGDGAVMGRNQVVVGKPPLIGDPDKPYTGPQIADKYASPTTSGLEVTVTEDADKNTFPLIITAR